MTGPEKLDRPLLPVKRTKTGEVLYPQDIPLAKGPRFGRNHGLWQWPREPLNIVCDSGYTIYTILHLDPALIKTSIDPNLFNLFLTLQSLLDKREHPFFITHI